MIPKAILSVNIFTLLLRLNQGQIKVRYIKLSGYSLSSYVLPLFLKLYYYLVFFYRIGDVFIITFHQK